MSGTSNMPLIWVTRPEPGATQSVDTLARRGYRALAVPLTRIVACDPMPALPDHSAHDVVAVTSANALRVLPDTLVARLRDRALFSVGDATAAVARELGFSHVRTASGDAETLAAMLVSKTKNNRTILYLCARQTSGRLEDALAASSRKHVSIPVYDVEKVSHSTHDLNQFFSHGKPDITLVHSAAGGRALLSLCEPCRVQQHIENSFIIAISRRVGTVLEPFFSRKVIIAAQPTEASMMACVDQIITRFG